MPRSNGIANKTSPSNKTLNREAPEMTSTSDKAQDFKQWATKTRSGSLLRVARFGLLLALGGIILSNARPYIDICGLLGSNLSSLGIVPLLLKMPLIGWLLSQGGALLAFGCGVILWFILQVLQMLPVLLRDSPQMMLNLIEWAAKFASIEVDKDDSPALASLKRHYNSIPSQWLNDANSARAIGYLIDLVLVGRFYPPIVGGYDRLGVFLAAPLLNDLDVSNIATGLFAMFGVEISYQVWKLFNGFIELSRENG
jgi:hypothetical protein